MRTVISLTVSLLLAPLDGLSAQQPPPIEPDSRIRVTAPNVGADKVVGTFLGAAGDTLRVQTESQAPLAIPFAFVTRLDVSRGKKSRVVRGAVLVGVIGAVVGGAVGLVTPQFACETPSGCPVDWGEAGKLAALGGVIGAAVGGGIGALTKTDRWEKVPLDQLRVSLVPQRDGRFALGLSVRF